MSLTASGHDRVAAHTQPSGAVLTESVTPDTPALPQTLVAVAALPDDLPAARWAVPLTARCRLVRPVAALTASGAMSLAGHVERWQLWHATPSL